MTPKERFREFLVVIAVGFLMAALIKGILWFAVPCSMADEGFSLGHMLIAGCRHGAS